MTTDAVKPPEGFNPNSTTQDLQKPFPFRFLFKMDEINDFS